MSGVEKYAGCRALGMGRRGRRGLRSLFEKSSAKTFILSMGWDCALTFRWYHADKVERSKLSEVVERLHKTPFCSALTASVSLIQCALSEFSYINSSTALLGCRRSCFAFVQTVCQPLSPSKRADGGIAKPRGCFLSVAEFYIDARYHGDGRVER